MVLGKGIGWADGFQGLRGKYGEERTATRSRVKSLENIAVAKYSSVPSFSFDLRGPHDSRAFVLFALIAFTATASVRNRGTVGITVSHGKAKRFREY